MKILSLTQPWATLIALGAKQIESRSWRTSYTGPLAIHAAKGLGPVGGRSGLHLLAHSPPFFAALQKAMMRVRVSRDGETWPEYDADLLPLGAIVALVELEAVHPIRHWPHDPETPTIIVSRISPKWVPVPEPERSFGDYSPGRYGWLLGRVRPLSEPLPYKGAQGLRTLPAAVAAQVEALAAEQEPRHG
jgi:hypothetical protein